MSVTAPGWSVIVVAPEEAVGALKVHLFVPEALVTGTNSCNESGPVSIPNGF
jgi:hypothetical protein